MRAYTKLSLARNGKITFHDSVLHIIDIYLITCRFSKLGLYTYQYEKQYYKVYKAISYNISERESESIKMCCINIHLTVNPFTFNKYCIYTYSDQNVVQQSKLP